MPIRFRSIGGWEVYYDDGSKGWIPDSPASLPSSPPPDPFGDAVRSAQEARPEPEPTYTPDDFTGPGFDADAAYRRAMGG